LFQGIRQIFEINDADLSFQPSEEAPAAPEPEPATPAPEE